MPTAVLGARSNHFKRVRVDHRAVPRHYMAGGWGWGGNIPEINWRPLSHSPASWRRCASSSAREPSGICASPPPGPGQRRADIEAKAIVAIYYGARPPPPFDPERILELVPGAGEGAGVPVEQDLAEVEPDARPRVGPEPVEGARRAAPPAEGERLGEVVAPPWGRELGSSLPCTPGSRRRIG